MPKGQYSKSNQKKKTNRQKQKGKSSKFGALVYFGLFCFGCLILGTSQFFVEQFQDDYHHVVGRRHLASTTESWIPNKNVRIDDAASYRLTTTSNSASYLRKESPQQQQQQELLPPPSTPKPGVDPNPPPPPDFLLSATDLLEFISMDFNKIPKPVSLSYVNVTTFAHPHMGALDEHDQWGYIHNETALRQKGPPSNFNNKIQKMLKRMCLVEDDEHYMLTEKIKVFGIGSSNNNNNSSSNTMASLSSSSNQQQQRQQPTRRRRIKLFCMIYSTEKSHDRIVPIVETWAYKCDGFMVGSTKTDKRLGAVNIPHMGPESYQNMFQKVRSMWSYVYDNYYEEYDWFHIGGDDMFVIVENLRSYLESEEIVRASNEGIYDLPQPQHVRQQHQQHQQGNKNEINNTTNDTWQQEGEEPQQPQLQTPLFLGRRLYRYGNHKDIYNNGGPGYTLNKAALKVLVTQAMPQFRPNRTSYAEDVVVAQSLRKFNIFPYNTKDTKGGERYMTNTPGSEFRYRYPKDPQKRNPYDKSLINPKDGPDGCSEYSISFHHVKKHEMYRYYALLYGACPSPPTAPQQQQPTPNTTSTTT